MKKITRKQLEYLSALTNRNWNMIGCDPFRLSRTQAKELIQYINIIRYKDERFSAYDIEYAKGIVLNLVRKIFPNFSLEELLAPNKGKRRNIKLSDLWKPNTECPTTSLNGKLEFLLKQGVGKQGFTYFLIEEGGAGVKIGFSYSPKYRKRSLNVGNPRKLNILFVIEGPQAIERFLHDRFSKYRINGEWFRIEDELKDFIDEHTTRIQKHTR